MNRNCSRYFLYLLILFLNYVRTCPQSLNNWKNRIRFVEEKIKHLAMSEHHSYHHSNTIQDTHIPEPNFPLFFIHIPKCGGTTFRHALFQASRDWNLTSFLPCHDITMGASYNLTDVATITSSSSLYVPCGTSCIEESCQLKPWWNHWSHHIAQSSVIGGHFSKPFSDPSLTSLAHHIKFDFIVLFRNPISRFISHYYHFIQLKAKMEFVKQHFDDQKEHLSDEGLIVGSWWSKSISQVLNTNNSHMELLLQLTIDPHRSLYVEYMGGYSPSHRSSTVEMEEESQNSSLLKAVKALQGTDVLVCLTELWQPSIELVATTYPWLGRALRNTRARNVRNDLNGSIVTNENEEQNDDKSIRRRNRLQRKERRKQRRMKQKQLEAEGKENEDEDESRVGRKTTISDNSTGFIFSASQTDFNNNYRSQLDSLTDNNIQFGRKLKHFDSPGKVGDNDRSKKGIDRSRHNFSMQQRLHETPHSLPLLLQRRLVFLLYPDLVLFVEAVAKFAVSNHSDKMQGKVSDGLITVLSDLKQLP